MLEKAIVTLWDELAFVGPAMLFMKKEQPGMWFLLLIVEFSIQLHNHACYMGR